MLNNNEHSVDQKVSLLQQALTKLVNVSENMNSNVNRLENKEINTIIRKENDLHNVVSILNSLYQILNDFHTIFDIIQETETAIAFSKLHILHQSIINSTELLNMLLGIEKYAVLIYPVSKDNLSKLERNIVVKSYISKGSLVFILEIPLVEPDTYIYYRVIPIPILDSHTHKTHTIIPSYPFLLVKRLKYRPVVSPCEEIQDGRFLCSDDNLAQYPVETCIEQIMLMKNNQSSCRQHAIQIESLKIQRIISNYWLLYSENNLIITEHCTEQVHKYQVQGSYIMSPNQQCRTQVGDVFINTPTNASVTSFQLPAVEVPALQEEIKKDTKQLDLRNVDFRDIKDILNSAKFSANGTPMDFLVKNEISVWTLMLYVIVFCCIVYVIISRFKLFIYCHRRNSPKSPVSPSDNFSLEEGGVKVANPRQISFVSTTAPATPAKPSRSCVINN
ncbi:hypothetical protein JYU34_016443 [Plutella xylostella]|uniref:Envelope fusion protein n=1 Tax=Plutella xylostella TaxID=51655 RepID=A0ABQ7Q2P5_PLUXY|nr:hypothetical protein JYU34_016443 [Plutella xylostella]